MEGNDEELRCNLDLIEELRDTTTIRKEEVKRRMAKYFDTNVRVKEFVVGNLVLKKVDAAARSSSIGKLNPNWAGPLIVKEVIKNRAYHL